LGSYQWDTLHEKYGYEQLQHVKLKGKKRRKEGEEGEDKKKRRK
jgi:hypothetical protein